MSSVPITASASPAAVVHEKQVLRRCGLHATNNILQHDGAHFSVDDFEGIAGEIQPGGDCCGNHHKAGCRQGASPTRPPRADSVPWCKCTYHASQATTALTSSW